MAEKPHVPASAFNQPHLRIDRFWHRADYRPPPRGFAQREEHRDRFSHGGKLTAELAQALAAAHRMLEQREASKAEGEPGVYIDISSEAALPDTAWQQKGIRIAAVRTDEAGAQTGGLFVPQKSEAFLERTLADYTRGEGTDAARKRLEQIEEIAPFTVATLWFDRRPLPGPGQSIWWECWCWKDRQSHLAGPAERLGLRVSDQRLIFPECVVVPVYGTRADIEKLLLHTDAVERLRNASDTPHVFLAEMADDQVPLIKDLAGRITASPDATTTACVLDTGANRGHPLLQASLHEDDQHAVDENWGVDDQHPGGHGTQMAGMALIGDLTYPVGDARQIILSHRLETVTLLPPGVFPATEPANYGYVTQQAISLPEAKAPGRARIFCMAVTNEDVPGDRTTSWSSAMDQAAAGKMEGEKNDPTAPKRLIMIAGGNIKDGTEPDPDKQPMEDPVQAWNTLGIGGFTDRDQVSGRLFNGYRPLASVGDRSPYSRTSSGWPGNMPLKPEVVFEAGNKAVSPGGTDLVSGLPSLSVLTINSDFIADPLTAFWATSAATGEATRFAATLAAAHKDLWAETLRALMIHSARWTPKMREHIADAKQRKSAHIALARQFGFGVPDLNRALASASSDLALIAQATIQPFMRSTKTGKKGKPIEDGDPKYHDIHIYELPWPVERLRELGEKRVELKVTLSYFIEPSPGQFQPITPARYRSHGLRFDLQRRLESVEEFLSRINGLAAATDHALDISEHEPGLDDDALDVETEADRGWMFGPNSRAQKSAGSLHCDVWLGSGADLAERRTLAIYPVSGWWKYRLPQKRYNDKTRYSLVLSLNCVEQDVDLYSEIETAISAAIPTVNVDA